jgi:hypothetical protein
MKKFWNKNKTDTKKPLDDLDGNTGITVQITPDGIKNISILAPSFPKCLYIYDKITKELEVKKVNNPINEAIR